MPATSPWLASAEAVFNRNIAASTEAASLVRRLEGTSLQVEVDGITRLRASVAGGRLALLAGDDSPADAHICGSAPALLQSMRSARPAPKAAASLQIRGDAEIANLYRQLFAAARPDLEEELSRWIGDLPARHLSLVAKSVRTWARRARRTAGENIAEYLQEEGRDLVTHVETQEFLESVDKVREAADRLEARILSVEQRTKGAT
ncbi:MAG TPA: SCP2 sterol-binding domain-containing protein [Steroidobacteraceae bacterium]|jgi:ubiquinone biosynthesis protein UbiJ